MRRPSRTRLAVLVIAIGATAIAVDRFVGIPGVSASKLGARGGERGFKGSDEELQTVTSRDRSGFKGSDEELAVTPSGGGGAAPAGN